MLPQLSLLLVQVGSLRVSLRAYGYVFAGGHRHCSGDQCREGRREHKTRRSSSCNHPERNAGDRNNSVVSAKYRGS